MIVFQCRRRLVSRMFLIFICFLVARYFSFSGIEEVQQYAKAPRLLNKNSKQNPSFIVPYLRGQGLNNQLWEYRTAAIVAKATNRILCLEPFHRFYLSQSGREFYPFEEIFDVEALSLYVEIAPGGGYCAKTCNYRLHRNILVANAGHGLKSFPKDAFSIPDWRPGSLKKFTKSTKFVTIEAPELMEVEIKGSDANLLDIHEKFHDLQNFKCIGVAGDSLFVPPDELLLWKNALVVSQRLKNITNLVQRTFFHSNKYMAIHWRFEESKCAGFGAGIGYGRDSRSFQAKPGNKVVRKLDSSSNLCFYGGRLKGISPEKLLLRMISKEAAAEWILNTMVSHGLSQVYLATDCRDRKLLNWIKRRTGAFTNEDLKVVLDGHISIEDNDVISRLEQQICVDSHVFAGTQKSSWTTTVIEERLEQTKEHNRFFLNKTSIFGVEKEKSKTLFFDVEVCNCENS